MSRNKEEVIERKSKLSPAKRVLLEQRLQGKVEFDAPQRVIPRRSDTGPAPLSFAQQRLWFLHQLQPNSPFYNEFAAFRLRGSLNASALEASFNQIVKRHEILRTAFATVQGQLVQTIFPASALSVWTVCLSELAADREREMERLAIKEVQQPFDLTEGSLLRVKLLRLGQEDHVLLLTLHHIISDGWSIGVFIQEVAAFYNAYLSRQPSLLPELPIQYADFAIWQRQQLQGEVLETQLAYWKQQLKSAPPMLELPADRPRPAVQTFQGARQSFVLHQRLTEALKTLSQREGTTLFMTLLAAFNLLLCRYTGDQDILIGTPIANRTQLETGRLIGFFVNTLVLRTNLSGNPSFRDLLARVRQMSLEAYTHQDLPFEKLVEELQPERDLSYNPLFQVMFDLQPTPKTVLELPNLTLTPLEVNSGAAKFDLSLDMMDNGQELMGAMEYSTDLFDAATITRMLGHFQALLESIVISPNQRRSDVSILTAAERHQLLMEWNNTQADYPQNICLHQLIEAQVKRTPDAIAVVFEDKQLTYRELDRRANQLAHSLQSLGVEPEVLVGICMEPSLEMVIGILGILKAGGAYLPLDSEYPKERLAFMLEDAQVPVLLIQQGLSEEIPECNAKVLCLDASWQVSLQEADEKPCSRATPDNLAYVIYTSGSTDKPKGVMITHGSLVNAYFAWQDAYSLQTVGTCHLQMASFSFDVFAGNLVRALCSGAKLVLCPREFLLVPGKLHQLMDQEVVDCAEFVPAVLRNLTQYLEETEQSLDFMQLLIVGSDSWYVQEHKAVQHFCSSETQLINSYGLTEATIDSTYFQHALADLSVDALVPIGCPFLNNQVYILDPYLQPVPIGVPGELHLGGAGLARGYLNRPELTAEKFIPNPFSDSGACLYKTGDLAHYLPDGNIEYLSRIDHQVKIRGFRVEIGEVEAVLGQHPGVREVVALVQGNELSKKRLVAYIVPYQKPAPTIHHLRGFLQEKLPDYMVPSTFIALDSLPLTPNGKLDRRALPIPDTARPDLAASLIAPRTLPEEILVKIWSEVLRIDQVGIHDNFFALGGDSILSIQVVARANQEGLRLTPKQLFQHQTIAELATLVDTAQMVQSEQSAVIGSLPLTPIQHWFFEQELTDTHHWNLSLLLEVRQAVNPVLLEQVVQHLLVHHDALRLRFTQDDVGWRQVNASPNDNTPFLHLDLSTLPKVEQTVALEAAATQLQASLNLLKGPLVRVALFDLGTQQPSRLLIAIHHLAVDGVSWRILLEDLQTAYEQLKQRQTIQLPPKTTSFQQWAERLIQYAQSTAMQHELDYWLARSNQPVPPLPVDYLEGINTITFAQTVSVSLTMEETQALLQEVPAAYHTQINDVLLTALVQAFAQWTGKPFLLVDLEGHGREEIFQGVDLSRTVGWFTTVFPVSLDLSQVSDPGAALKAVKEQLRSIPKRGIGYGLLRYLSQEGVVEQLRLQPQAEVSFNYLGQLDQSFSEASLFRLAQESSGQLHSVEGSRYYLLEIDGFIAGGRLQTSWTYSASVHQRGTIENLAQRFVEMLRSLIAHCCSPEAGGYTPSDFPLAQLNQDELNAVFETVEFTGG